MSANTVVVVLDSTLTADTLRPWLAHERRVALVGPGRIADLGQLSDDLGATHVVIAARHPDGRAARLAATILAGARPRVAVAHRVGATSAIALAASAVTALESHTDPGGVLATFDQMVARSVGGMWLHKVTGLQYPRPGFGMHVRSLVSRGFVASMTPVPQISRALALSDDLQTVLVGAEETSREFTALQGVSAGRRLQAVPAISDVTRAHGSRGVEFVALAPVSAPTLAPNPCPSCGARSAVQICQYCHVHLRVSEPA